MNGQDMLQTESRYKRFGAAWGVVLLALASSACLNEAENSLQECTRLSSLGKEPGKLNELRTWFTARWEDEQFRAVFENINYAYALGDSQRFAMIELDWQRYEIREEFGSISVSDKVNDDGLPLWFTVGEIRSALYIELEDIGALTNSAVKNSWSVLSEGAYLDCVR